MRKMTKATKISAAVKKAVHARDGGLCVICKRPGDPVAHVVRRSQGGRGIEKNVVTLCPWCHRSFDEGRPEFRRHAYVTIVAHLKGFYPDWSREDMIYRKGDQKGFD